MRLIYFGNLAFVPIFSRSKQKIRFKMDIGFFNFENDSTQFYILNTTEEYGNMKEAFYNGIKYLQYEYLLFFQKAIKRGINL